MKPLVYSSLHLKSLEIYRSFLLRRPKNIHTFQFSATKPQQPSVQNKLSQVLSLLKPIRKVDLSEFELNQDSPKLLQAFKKISKVKTLSLSRSHKDFIETTLRYFPQVKYLKYQLNGVFKKRADSLDYSNTHYLSALKHLRYCSKLQKLLLRDSVRWYLFKKTSTKLQKSIDNFQLDKVLPRSMRGGSNELIYIRLYFYIRNRGRVYEKHLNLLPDLSNLQQLSIWVDGRAISAEGVDKALQKIAPQKNLKEVKLIFNLIYVQLEGVLEPFTECKLTYFVLLAHVNYEEDLQSLAKFLRNMNQLKYLDIEVFYDSYYKPKALHEICQNINNLEALQHLKLAFYGEDAPDHTKQANFLPCLHRVFTKQIKLETLRISCNQVNYDETIQDLPSRLQGVENSLLKFTLNLESLGTPLSRPNQNNNLQKMVDLIKPLSNVRELGFPRLFIDSDECLDAIVGSVLEFKYLEVLKIGDIQQIGPRFHNLIEKILTKKGLRIFCCKISRNLQKDIRKEVFDIKKIIRANPYLEQAQFHPLYSERGRGDLLEIHKWS